ncbi:MAG TPA: hypothetical protein VGZ73_08950 [Bryobacteraceae bacterium]|nr:hypothetical protein [Bryobacteraceae bacterium]
MANEIEQDEPSAESAHVPNDARQLAFREVMAKMHGEGHIGRRQRIAQCVGLDYRNGRGDSRMRSEVSTHHFNPQPAPHLF